jgi:hypothetical protein
MAELCSPNPAKQPINLATVNLTLLFAIHCKKSSGCLGGAWRFTLGDLQHKLKTLSVDYLFLLSITKCVLWQSATLRFSKMPRHMLHEYCIYLPV